ncbi:hypothetical protein GWK47_037114 [Chionoecetes opilio]|uniref:Uncharacterized protein n=1 Tax=Chionoecetes opilio TaxID=41210 RepID=A0A8J5CYT5_CHIOP|nr:hypothetical protein GWK47_037114 [Chionoecetes opilio]
MRAALPFTPTQHPNPLQGGGGGRAGPQGGGGEAGTGGSAPGDGVCSRSDRKFAPESSCSPFLGSSPDAHAHSAPPSLGCCRWRPVGGAVAQRTGATAFSWPQLSVVGERGVLRPSACALSAESGRPCRVTRGRWRLAWGPTFAASYPDPTWWGPIEPDSLPLRAKACRCPGWWDDPPLSFGSAVGGPEPRQESGDYHVASRRCRAFRGRADGHQLSWGWTLSDVRQDSLSPPGRTGHLFPHTRVDRAVSKIYTAVPLGDLGQAHQACSQLPGVHMGFAARHRCPGHGQPEFLSATPPTSRRKTLARDGPHCTHRGEGHQLVRSLLAGRWTISEPQRVLMALFGAPEPPL